MTSAGDVMPTARSVSVCVSWLVLTTVMAERVLLLRRVLPGAGGVLSTKLVKTVNSPPASPRTMSVPSMAKTPDEASSTCSWGSGVVRRPLALPGMSSGATVKMGWPGVRP